MKHLNITEIKNLEDRFRVNLINSLSGFKSANLLGTKSMDGKSNLSIVSSFFHVGANPPLQGFISRPNTVERHTIENIKETKCFTFNHVHQSFYQKAHQTSARYPREVSEFDACQLTEEYLGHFFAPFVKESKIKAAFELVRIIPIEENNTDLILAQLTDLYLSEEIIEDDGYLNLERAGSLCLSGLDHYHQTKLLEKLPYAKPDKKI